MTLAISISRIADSIYAQSALDAAAHGIDTPAALTRAHSDAIENLIVKLTAETITSLGASVRSTNIGTLGPGDDIITIEYDVAHHDASVACLRTNIETAIAYGVLAPQRGRPFLWRNGTAPSRTPPHSPSTGA